MKNLWKIMLMTSLLLLSSNLQSQTGRFRLLDTTYGLFNNQVRFLVQMQDGKILAYTEGMFNLFNGHDFEPLTCDLDHTLPLGMHNICTAYDGGNGLLWAKDYYRLYLFDTRTHRFCDDIKKRFEAARLQESVNDFILDQDKNAWIITEKGRLYRYDWKHSALPVYSLPEEEYRAGIRIRDVMQAGPFHLIFLNTGKMLCWEGKSRRIVGEDYTVATPRPMVTFRTTWIQADEQHLLISVSHTEGYLYSYNIYTREWRVVLKGKAINDIKRCKDGSFILGGNYTLIHMSKDLKILQEETVFNTSDNGQIRDFIMSVLIDDQQGVWLGLSSSGILKALPQEKYATCHVNTDAQHNESRIMRSLCRYDDRRLLVGTMHGIFLFDTTEKRFRPFLPDFAGLHCTDIKQDRKGQFWLSTHNGLYCLPDNTTGRYRRIDMPDISSSTVRFSLPLSDGSILACVNLKDLYIYHPDNGSITRIDNKFPGQERIRAMSFALETGDGQLLVGTQNGLFSYDLKQGKAGQADFIAPFEKYSTKYNCIYADKDVVWIGTQNGLIRHHFKTGQSRRFSTEDGLSNNCIQSITATPDGQLWVATPNGVCNLRKDSLGNIFIVRLEKEDGIRGGEMMEQSIATMPDGHIYIGSINSIIDLPSQSTVYENSDASPVMVGLRVMNQPIDNKGIFNGRQLLPEGMSYTKTIKLKYNENFLQMRFSALNYETPEHIRYRYRLTDVDKDWNYSSTATGICTASYTSLAPGTYTLQVEAALEYQPWGKTAAWQIIIAPPLWKTWWAYTLYALAILALIYYGLELYFADKRSRMMAEQEMLKRQKEQHLDELKFRFFTNISHEFRTPLALIITPLELLIRETEDNKLKTRLEKILGNAKELLRLVNQLLDFRRLEQKGEHLKIAAIQIKPFIEECVSPFSELAQEHHIELVCECMFAENDIFHLDAEKIKRVLNNLISNAIKFTPEGGVVSVQAEWAEPAGNGDRPAGIRIRVSDTGTGIKPEDLDNIFVRFFQCEQSPGAGINTGSGIGLHLTKGYVDLHKGTIDVESTPGKGTVFTVTLPYPEQPAQPADRQLQTVTAEGTEKKQTATGQEKNITLLIAEDNAQFRTFMKDLLMTDFHILTAANGKEGLEKAQKYNPDLIISDVMMPEMDGYAFCRAIKNDVKCSHIPFILLTARNSSESRSGAYDAGADSFITKPFDIEVLTSRIRQLLEQRAKRQALFRKEIQLTPKDITTTSLDEKLIQKAIECMEKNMDNTEYNVESLCTDLGIERTKLYRKMQAIVGQTPMEFMRTIRLKRAAQLLKSGKHTVQEISWMVGFNTPRYFSAYFKEMFGMTPSQYIGQRSAKEKESDKQS